MQKRAAGICRWWRLPLASAPLQGALEHSICRYTVSFLKKNHFQPGVDNIFNKIAAFFVPYIQGFVLFLNACFYYVYWRYTWRPEEAFPPPEQELLAPQRVLRTEFQDLREQPVLSNAESSLQSPYLSSLSFYVCNSWPWKMKHSTQLSHNS